jgi:6-phosphogluconolactonase
MTSLTRREFATGAELAPAFAHWTASLLTSAVATRGVALLAVSGGTSPRRYFEALSNEPVDWSRVVVTLVDERRVADDDPRSNARLVRQTLLQNRAAKAEFVSLANSRLSPDQELAGARARVAALPLPADLVVLGMGDDGHTASWFPRANGLAEAMDPAARALVAPITAAGAPEPRLTLTGRAILRARQLALLIEGADKLATLAKALDDGPIADMPIRAVLRGTLDRLTIFEAGQA